MGSQGEDIVLGDQSRAKFPYSIEAKHRQSYAGLYDAYNQAVCNAKPGIEPLFIVRTNRELPLVVMSFEHFMLLASHNLQSFGPFSEVE